MTKKSLALLATLTLTTFAAQGAGDPVDLLYKPSPWRFVKKKLVDDPRNKGGSLLGKISTYGLTAGSMVPGALFLKQYIEGMMDEDSEASIPMHTLNIGLTTLALTAVPYLVHKFAKKQIEKPLNAKALNPIAFENFVVNWKENKPHTPKEIHSFFDDIYAQYQELKNEDVAPSFFPEPVVEEEPSFLTDNEPVLEEKPIEPAPEKIVPTRYKAKLFLRQVAPEAIKYITEVVEEFKSSNDPNRKKISRSQAVK